MSPLRWVRLTCGVVLASALSLGAISAPADARSTDPRPTRAFYVDPRTPAAQAARADSTYAAIANRPQAMWLTDRYPVKGTKGVVSVRTAAADYADRARAKKRTPIVAIYAIPDRDCGQHSSGGLTAAAYRTWVRHAAAGLKGKKAIAILEPDALALHGSSHCKNSAERIALLRYAAKRLHAAGVWVYIDAGHSRWHSPAEIARRLVSVNIKKYAKGFSLNVGNFQRTRDEIAFGNKVVAELRKRGVTGRRYVIETARNGADDPPADGHDTCNPAGQRIGKKSEWPRMVRKGNLEAYVWIKHPGESDGPCNGGPSAGTWWPQGARQLLGR